MSTRTLLLCRPVKPQTRVAACPFRCIVSRAAGACRLQTGMRGAFGKPQGWVARCMINQIIYSVRTKPAFEGAAHEALRRAKFKIPGRQYVVTSTKHGFTEIEKSEDTITKNSRYNLSYSQLKEKKLLVKVRRFCGFTIRGASSLELVFGCLQNGVDVKVLNGHGPLFANIHLGQTVV